MNEDELCEMAADLQARVEKEVWLRLLEAGFAGDVRRHPELPAPALTAEFDQYLAGERVAARVYDPLVQHIADTSLARLSEDTTGSFLALCGVCLVTGSDEHRRP